MSFRIPSLCGRTQRAEKQALPCPCGKPACKCGRGGKIARNSACKSAGKQNAAGNPRAFLLENSRSTYDELAEKLGKTRETVRANLRTLEKNGLIERIGADKNGCWNILLPRDEASDSRGVRPDGRKRKTPVGNNSRTQHSHGQAIRQ
ncbi:MAG: Lrp/AsnC family transcriptional regulator [Treponemataceae bacterium]|nr:Lrp/AsnC family transcriptional regulator [Treponemataceae bacterium]